jgi:hypothetical protein
VDSPSLVNRRPALKRAGALGLAVGALEMAGPLAYIPDRAVAATGPSDIQHDIGAFLTTPPQASETGVPLQMPPVHTVFLTATLGRMPTRADQAEMNRVLTVLEQNFLWGAAQLVTFVSYGVPYFNRLPGGLNGTLVSSHMPRLLSNTSRFALEEAVPSPTDFGQPSITKLRYSVPVRIESNDLCITLRSDSPSIISMVLAWFSGNDQIGGHAIPSPAWNGFINFTSSRAMFIQRGLPQAVAQHSGLPFANFVQHQSPMWLGFADQQTSASGSAAITTFAGNSSAKLTNAAAGDYFDNGSIQHLAHDILDLLQWFEMNTAAVGPTAGRTGHRIGHQAALLYSSRAADGTPIHIRNDGPGFDSMDVPDGSNQPKLQFNIFVPTADFFRTLRANTAAQDLHNADGVPVSDNGLERFITATRRQNFLSPPRRNRAFPLIEFT